MPNDQQPIDRDTLNTIFNVLRHGTRRQILMELADHTPRREAEFEAEEFTADRGTPDSIETGLYHTHLPKLADAGFIDWDPQTETITRGPRFSEITPLLVLIDDHQDAVPVDWP